MKKKKFLYYVFFIILIFFALLYFFSRIDKTEKNDAGLKSKIEINDEKSLLAKELEKNIAVDNQPALVDEAKEVFNSDLSENPELTPIVSLAVDISQKELTAIVLENKSTGAQSGSGLSDEEKLVWVQIWNLRDASPVETNSFQLSFNSQTRFFDVYLKNNATQEEFYLWLAENNYQQIPKDQFVFMVR